MVNRPPHTFQPGLASSPKHPLTSTPSSIWLLFILIKRRPPKAKAPLLSLLFDASYFASPSEQTNDSECNPDSLRPAHGIGEQWRHDLVVPLLYPWRERGQSRWRVGWHGSLCWLLCLCVLCFLFCASSKTIRCSQVSQYLIFWKMKIMSYDFWQVPTFIYQITTEKKGTVVWPSQTSAPFFLIVICNLIKEPTKKYSDEPAKTIRHCNRWPDDCTFFSGCNLIKEPSKTIQAHGTPKHSNSQITICFVKIRTPPITL
jgi:hypothetical protein